MSWISMPQVESVHAMGSPRDAILRGMVEQFRMEFSKNERAIIERHRTPAEVQRYLRSLPYNWKNTLRTFRKVVQCHTANCIEAALAAAAIMEQHGHPPLLLDLESVDKLDHVLFLYRIDGRWGTVGKSRDAGLHGRKPVFRSVRDLVWSYVEPYVDATGRICGYGVADLNDLTSADWRLSERNVWTVEKALIARPRKSLRISEVRYRKMLRRYGEFKKRWPDQPFPYSDPLQRWL
jgi:hypothetical protein